MNSAIYLFSIAAFVFIGIIGLVISKRLKIPHSLVIIAIGFLFGRLQENTDKIIIPTEFIQGVILLSLMMIVFDIFSRMESRNTMHARVRSFKIIYFLIAIPLLALSSQILFSFNNIILACFIGVLALPNSRSYINNFTPKRNKISQFIEIESLKVTAVVIILSAILLQMLKTTNSQPFYIPWIMDITLGLGTGIFSGIIFIQLMKKLPSNLSHIVLITAVLITYSAAESMGGNPLFGVIAFGYFFGAATIKKKPFLYEFSSSVAEFSEILILLLLGIFLKDITLTLIWKSFILYLILILIRYVSLSFTLKAHQEEIFFLALFSPKDIVTGTILLFVLTYFRFPGMDILFHVLLFIMIYSVIGSFLASKYEHKILKKFSKGDISDI